MDPCIGNSSAGRSSQLQTHNSPHPCDPPAAPQCRFAYMLGVQPMAAVHPGSFSRTVGTALVLLNGNVLGVHSRPHAFVDGFRLARRRGLLSEFASIVFMQDSIQISVDGGRLCRPLVICSNGRPRLTQDHVDVRPPSSASIPCCCHVACGWGLHRMPSVLLPPARRTSQHMLLKPL